MECRTLLFIRRASAVLLSCLLSTLVAAASATSIGPMTLAIPPSWAPRSGATPTVASYTLPGGTPAQQAIVAMSAAPDAGAGPAAGHQMLWNAIVQLTGRPLQQRSGQLGRFVWTEMRVTNMQTSRDEWHRLYSTTHDGVLAAVAIVANAEPAFVAAVSAVEPVLAAAGFGAGSVTVAAAPSVGTPGRAAATPPTARPADDVAIVEAHVHVDIRSISTTSGVLTDHVLFFANGIVAREGVINGPRECYALVDVRQLAKLPFNYGRWREDKAAGTVQILWQEGPAWTLRREAAGLSLGGKRLLPLRPLDGLRLDGVFEYRPVGDPPSRLELRRDGRFDAVNLRERMGCPMQAPPGALAGGGRYEIRKWTLFLRFADGRVTALPLHVHADETLERIGKFWLNGHDFVRLR